MSLRDCNAVESPRSKHVMRASAHCAACDTASKTHNRHNTCLYRLVLVLRLPALALSHSVMVVTMKYGEIRHPRSAEAMVRSVTVYRSRTAGIIGTPSRQGIRRAENHVCCRREDQCYSSKQVVCGWGCSSLLSLMGHCESC
jgi:hypothetical protein